MPLLLRLIILFTIVPLVELAILIKVGTVLGTARTILIVIATGILGAVLAKLEGLRVLEEIRNKISEGEVPARDVLVFGDLALDLTRHEVSRDGEPLGLRPKEFELLVFLARNPGMVLSRDLILERVWGWDYVGGSRTVDVHVRWLREKIEPEPADPVRIVTVRGVGYRFDG